MNIMLENWSCFPLRSQQHQSHWGGTTRDAGAQTPLVFFMSNTPQNISMLGLSASAHGTKLSGNRPSPKHRPQPSSSLGSPALRSDHSAPWVVLPLLGPLMFQSLVLLSLLCYTYNHKDIHCLIHRDLPAWQSITIIRTGHKTGI